MNLSSTLSVTRSFLTLSWNHEYNLSIPVPRYSLPCFLDALLQNLLAPILRENGDILRDLKGIDLTLSRLLPEHPPAVVDELLFVQGAVIETDSTKRKIMSPFTASIATSFDSFEGQRHIIHRIKRTVSGSLPESFPILHLGRAVPAEVEYFRIGIDLFRSFSISSSLGFAPSVTETLQIEGRGSELLVRISAERLRKRDQLPLGDHGILPHLDRALRAAVDFSIVDDLHAKMAGA